MKYFICIVLTALAFVVMIALARCDGKPCPGCHVIVTWESNYCNYCGYPLEEAC